VGVHSLGYGTTGGDEVSEGKLAGSLLFRFENYILVVTQSLLKL
jgi:hypothetical protein